MVDKSIGCPLFLPLTEDDIKLTNVTVEAAILQPDVPLSSHLRKELFYKFFQGFAQSIAADPALIKTEIQYKLQHFDRLYGIRYESEEERARAYRFTQGDYRRFAALFYLQTRRLVQETMFLMQREKKKRMMMRHIMTAAKLIGLIPEN